MSIKERGGEEVILAPSLLSRFGSLNLDDFFTLAKLAKNNKLKTICEWDILLDERQFQKVRLEIQRHSFAEIDEFRVQDMGVLGYVFKNFNQKIQYIAESSNHNMNSLIAIENYLGQRLDRMILSIELPIDKLQEYSKRLSVPTEVLAFGRIQLFYGPRKLLDPLFPKKNKKDNGPIEMEAHSQESPHRGFPVIQNSHGTFMMNPKDHCIIENSKELLASGIAYLRLDLRFDDSFQSLPLLLSIMKNPSVDLMNQLRELNPRPLIRGFFRVNKTDHQFVKLKNHRIQRRDPYFVGEVLDVKKKSFIAIRLKGHANEIEVGSWLEFHTPEGKIKKLQLSFLCNSKNEKILTPLLGQVLYINHVSGVSVRTTVYLCKPHETN